MEQLKRVLGTIVPLMVMAGPATAQHAGAVTGSVTDAQGLRVPGATVVVRTPGGGGGIVAATVTDGTGSFVIEGVSHGEYVLEASLHGFERHEASIEVGLGQAPLAITLEVDAVSDEVLVTAPRPEMTTEAFIPAPALDGRVLPDVAQALRSRPGVNARRSGPINLDPSIRGLSAEQIGVFVDGTRTFAAGPARMDSALSHVSPRALQRLRVVRGPYALTWGAGTLSAIRAETFKPAFGDGGDFRLGGRAGYDRGGNGASNDGFASLYGSSDRVRFAFHHNTRTASDYTDGNGATVQGDYESFDTRWDVGAWLSRETLLEYSGGFQRQNDIDYPGRLLDAAFFATRSHALKLSHAPDSGVITEIAGQAYANLKDHLMNNDGKPTALRDDHRTPPFPIRVHLPTSADTVGGRFHAALQTGPVRYRLGFDGYRLRQSATQTVSDRETGRVHHNRHPVWPDVTLTNAGAYAQVQADRGRSTIGATLRLDRERTQLGQVTSFFARHAVPAYAIEAVHGRFPCVTAQCMPPMPGRRMHGRPIHGRTAGHSMGHPGDPMASHGASLLVSGGHFAQANTNVSAAASAKRSLTDNWELTFGAGRAGRNPSALERYADRFPAVKFQTAAEFVGNPHLVPEKSVELNAGTTVRAARAAITLDAFWRNVADYITVAPDPNLSSRLPLSPEQVFRYVQADAARFAGFELTAIAEAGPWIDLRGGWSYVRARDLLFAEPLFGVPPFEQQYMLDIHSPSRTRWIELVVTSTARQQRVAARRFELPTAGWTTIDLLAGVKLSDSGLTLRAGLRNLTDEYYMNHLNALNPFTARRVAELGRSAYLGVELEF